MADAGAALVVVADVPAEGVEARAGGGRVGRAGDHLRHVARGKRVGLDDLLAVERAVAELEAQEAEHVVERSAGAAGRGFRVRIAIVKRRPAAVLQAGVDMRPILVGEIVRVAVAGRRHAGRLEQHLVGKVFPALACRHRGGDAAGRVAEIAVVIGRAEWIERLLVEMGEDVVPVEAEILEQVAGPGAQAAAMR